MTIYDRFELLQVLCAGPMLLMFVAGMIWYAAWEWRESKREQRARGKR